MTAPGMIRMIEIDSASTRNAAIRRSLVWELSDMKPLSGIVVQRPAGVAMNARTRNLYLLAGLMLVAACGREHIVRSKGTATINRSWPAAEIRHIKVFEVSGTVKVEAAPVQQIVLVATASGDLDIKNGAENQGLFE